MWLKGCPKCGGDLYKDRDVYGAFVSCIQCGMHKDVAIELPKTALAMGLNQTRKTLVIARGKADGVRV